MVLIARQWHPVNRGHEQDRRQLGTTRFPVVKRQPNTTLLEVTNRGCWLARLPARFPSSGSLCWRPVSLCVPVRFPLSMEMLCHE